MIGRRGFLGQLLLLPLVKVAPLVTVEKTAAMRPSVTLAEIDAVAREVLYPGVIDSYFTNNALVEYLKGRTTTRWQAGQLDLPFGD